MQLKMCGFQENVWFPRKCATTSETLFLFPKFSSVRTTSSEFFERPNGWNNFLILWKWWRPNSLQWKAKTKARKFKIIFWFSETDDQPTYSAEKHRNEFLVVHVAVAINIGLHSHLLRSKGCFKLSVFAYFALSYLKLFLPGASERFIWDSEKHLCLCKGEDVPNSLHDLGVGNREC